MIDISSLLMTRRNGGGNEDSPCFGNDFDAKSVAWPKWAVPLRPVNG